MPRTVHLVYFDAGGGHAAAARALAEALRLCAGPSAALVNLQEILDPLDFVRRLTGLRMQDGYNLMLRREWTLGAAAFLPPLQAAIALRRRALERALEDFWRGHPASAVVSLVPHFNGVLHAGLRRALPGALFAVALTDLADYPVVLRRWFRSMWLTARPDLVFCGTETAAAQARTRGCAPATVVRTSGMILRPSFYAAASASALTAEERRRCREGLGLEPDLPTALVLFGGAGSRRMLLVAAQLERVNTPLQVIYLCGRNAQVAAALAAMPSRRPRRIERFTDNVAQWMQLADIFIGKPGPGSLSEAVQMGLPAIVERDAWTLPQERFNATWLEEHGYGLVLGTFAGLQPRLEWLLAPGRLQEFRRRLAGVQNRAVFEIAARLIEELDRRSPSAAHAGEPAATLTAAG